MSTSIHESPTSTVAPGFLELVDDGIDVIGPRILHANVAAGDGARHQIGAGFDAIGQHFVGRAAQALHALDDDSVGACALDLGAHGNQEIGQIDHLGLARGILEHRLALGQRRGHHQILGAGDGDGLQHQPRAFQRCGTRLDIAVLDVNVGAHGLQAGDVNIDRTRADRAAAGQRHVRRAEARQQRTQHQNRCAHGLHELVRREIFLDGRGIDFDAHLFIDGHRHAHASEQLDHGRDILQMRHIRHRHRTVRQQAAGEYRQRRILGAGDADLALERDAAVNL